MKMSKQAMLEWETSEFIIMRHLKSADAEIQKFHGRAAMFSTNRKTRDQFISKRLPELIKQVTEG